MVRWGALALLCAWAGAGCAYYSTSGGIVGGIRTVAIPLARNETSEFGLAELLSERAEQSYAADGRIRVVDEESADAVLYLTIRSVRDAPFTYTADEITEQYRFVMEVKAELVRSEDGRTLLELPDLEGWGTYDAALDDAEGRAPAMAAAVVMVVDELLDRAVSSW